MNDIRQKWYDLSIKSKSRLLMGTMLTLMWLLVLLLLVQLQSFSRQAGIIMNDYMDITAFLDAFSEENVCLEAYTRPKDDTTSLYMDAIAETDRCLADLQSSQSSGSDGEPALKHAVFNAMEHYRASQAALMSINKENPAFIAQYLSLKRQSSYIDGYAREMLHARMAQGITQFQEAEVRNTQRTQAFLLYMLLASLLLCLVLMLFSRSILRPLSNLCAAAAEIGAGRYDAPPLEVRSRDELGTVSHAFNLMQTEIRHTIHSLEHQSEMEKHLRETEMLAAQMQHSLQEGRFAQLQSQINPHFLFNTLSTIAALAREEGAPLSEDLILRLSNFFRYSLESDEKVVTLARELHLLQDYMELQETRYGDRITMQIISDPTLDEVMVPKFILQPLVENAILHGLKACAGGGQIRVRTRRGRRGITITVTDNGCGFDTRQNRDSGPHRSVGLENIAERMRLSNGRLDVFSIPGVGTTARIIVGGERT